MAEPGSLGLSYHRSLDAAILGARRRLGHVELMADHFLDHPEAWGALSRLKSFLPVTVHGVGLSLGSAEGLDPAYLGKLWRFLDFVRPVWFSEHLAITRAGGRELPHFAPLPRDRAALRALDANVRLLKSCLPCPLLVENPAFPILPAGDWSEPEFLARACDAAGAGLLLDLHNLHANAANLGFDAFAALQTMPLERVRQVHLAGGYRGTRWLVDSHTRPVPPEVYALLTRLRELGPDPAVTLEWDDELPAFAVLLEQLHAADRPAINEKRVIHAASLRSSVDKSCDLEAYQRRFVSAMLDGANGAVQGISVADLRAYAAGLKRKASKFPRASPQLTPE